MNTAGNSSTTTTTTAGTPAHPAKGNQRGQTTLAAEIDRWQAMASNLAPQIEQLPGLKEPFAQFQALLAQAIAVRNQLNTLKADTATAFSQRDQLLGDGAVLFSRLRLGLQSAHGTQSPRLHEFGLKPHKKTGRPPKSTDTTPPPPVEVAAHPPAAAEPPIAASHENK
jgi:hypothetical protein